MDHSAHKTAHQSRSRASGRLAESRVRYSRQVRRENAAGIHPENQSLMSTRGSVTQRPRVVGVITSRADLDRATRMRKPPDLFELRLDCLLPLVDQLENKLPRLRVPLIITARHPQEGGVNKLSLRQRRDLL